MGKGGVLGSFVLVKLDKGTSKRYSGDEDSRKDIAGTTSPKSPLVYVKEPIAKLFAFKELTPTEARKFATRQVKTKISGKEVTITTTVASGATGASRSVTVRFTKLMDIGGKQVASVKIAMPSSYTFNNMIEELVEGPQSGNIASIVSPEGRSVTYRTPYKPKKAG